MRGVFFYRKKTANFLSLTLLFRWKYKNIISGYVDTLRLNIEHTETRPTSSPWFLWNQMFQSQKSLRKNNRILSIQTWRITKLSREDFEHVEKSVCRIYKIMKRGKKRNDNKLEMTSSGWKLRMTRWEGAFFERSPCNPEERPVFESFSISSLIGCTFLPLFPPRSSRNYPLPCSCPPFPSTRSRRRCSNCCRFRYAPSLSSLHRSSFPSLSPDSLRFPAHIIRHGEH